MWFSLVNVTKTLCWLYMAQDVFIGVHAGKLLGNMTFQQKKVCERDGGKEGGGERERETWIW